MIDAIIGTKIGMTQIFNKEGRAVPVTVIEAGPCVVTQVKTKQNDGYEAVQIAYGTRKNLNKPDQGHLGLYKGTNAQKAGRAHRAENLEEKLPLARHLREVRTGKPLELNLGDKVTVDIFKEGDYVDVTGTSKGRGFAGVMKRHNFAGGKRTHGQSDRLRAPGSIGPGTTMSRVLKNMRMAGHMGDVKVTTQNIRVAVIDTERNLILVSGSVPGANGGLVTVRKAVKGGK